MLHLKELNHSTVLVLQPHLAVFHHPMLFNVTVPGKRVFPIILPKAKRTRFVFFYHLEKSGNWHYKSAFVLSFCFPFSRKRRLGYAGQTCQVAVAVALWQCFGTHRGVANIEVTPSPCWNWTQKPSLGISCNYKNKVLVTGKKSTFYV